MVALTYFSNSGGVKLSIFHKFVQFLENSRLKMATNKAD